MISRSLGLNFINALNTAFTLTEPKSVKKTVKSSISLFTLLGSTSEKAERKYVGEVEPWSPVLSFDPQVRNLHILVRMLSYCK